ncbi:RNA-binding GTPase NUG1 [Sporobolomyces koalae]|uniref:RNA-binding GTPase NUG1 n=1 Tax=Sporobolomyces koalae TaxID=500713 RepID=UPI00318158C6
MVKIRKKTSNRTTTRMRAKVKHKVAEHQKKAKKAAKKDVTWKSNKPKDLGIPNSFPYKDQVLAEAAAEKQRLEEEKIARREAQRNGTSATFASTAALAAALAADSAMDEDMQDDEDQEELVQDPSLKLHAKSLRKVLEMSDVVIEVLDARDPVGTRCRAVERELKALDGGRKKLVLVLNKIDLVPPQVVQAWLAHLRLQAPTIPFKSSTQQQRNHLSASSTATPQSASGSSTKPLLELIKGFRNNGAGPSTSAAAVKTSLTIGLVGHPNVGKSSLINTLKRSKACSVAPTPGWTKEVQEVVLEKGVRVLDCPGVVVEARGELESALKGMIKAEEVRDPKGPVEIILQRCQQTHLQMLYNIPAFSGVTSFLLEVARAKGRLRKGGVPDLDGTARSILRDWVQGRIPYYTSPPSAAATQAVKEQTEQTSLENVTDADVDSAQILTSFAPAFDLAALFGEADAVAFGEGGAGSAVQGKKAVKMQDGAMGMESDDANVGWVADEAEPIEMDDDEDDLNLDDLVDDDDEMEDDDDDEEEAPELVPAVEPVSKKTKRTAPQSQIVSVAPPSKKSKSVSFSSKPLGPTGSTAVNAATSNAREILSAGVDEVGLNKANKKAAKKDKKKAAKKANKAKGEVDEATKEFGEDAELPSKPRGARTVAGVGIGEAYDFGEFFGNKSQPAHADDDDDEL